VRRVWARYGRADKLSKMPQWISQYLRGDLLNMSIVEAAQLAKRFFHDMARPMTARMESSILMDVSSLRYSPAASDASGAVEALASTGRATTAASSLRGAGGESEGGRGGGDSAIAAHNEVAGGGRPVVDGSEAEVVGKEDTSGRGGAASAFAAAAPLPAPKRLKLQ
jgi:hypothetical protein